MSPASADVLRKRFGDAKRFGDDDRVVVVLDADGERVFLDRVGEDQFDLVLYLSVVHHIPDYLTHLRRMLARISVGGDLITFQDPLYLPRRSRPGLLADRGAYLVWRLGQGNYLLGLQTRVRRIRGVLDENEESDMVEYHAVRQGVDEAACIALLSPCFASTELTTYWSTPSSALQSVGEWIGSAPLDLRASRHRPQRRRRAGVGPWRGRRYRRPASSRAATAAPSVSTGR